MRGKIHCIFLIYRQFQFIPSKYVIIGDYEFIFSQNFEQKMRPLAKQEFTKNPKSVLVFRTFEINESVVRFVHKF